MGRHEVRKGTMMKDPKVAQNNSYISSRLNPLTTTKVYAYLAASAIANRKLMYKASFPKSLALEAQDN